MGELDSVTAGNGPLKAMTDKYLERMSEGVPSSADMQGALSSLQSATRNVGVAPETPYWQNMLKGLTEAPSTQWDKASPAMFQYANQWETTQREAKQKGEYLAQKQMYDDMQKRRAMYDAEAKPLLAAQARARINGDILPNGNRRVKTGDREYEIVPAPDTPEGYYYKEIVSSNKSTLGANERMKLAAVYAQEATNAQAWGPNDDAKRQEYYQQQLSKYNQLLDEQMAKHISSAPSKVPPANAPGGAATPGAPAAAPIGTATPGAPAAAALAPQPQGAPPVGDMLVDKGAKEDFNFDVSGMTPEDKDLIQRQITRYRANPTPGTLKVALDSINGLLSTGRMKRAEPAAAAAPAQGPSDFPTATIAKPAAAAPAAAPAAVQSGVPLKTPMTTEFAKVSGGKLAERLDKTLTEHQTGFEANTKLLDQLDTLDKLWSRNDLPEGELAQFKQKAGSALKSFGIDISDATGPADLANSASRAMALQMRTAGGTNLMPGAMSNFDAELLISMTPNLSQTQQGRATLTKLMKSMAESQQRIHTAALEAAANNGGTLPTDWGATATKLAKQEIAKRTLMKYRIMNEMESYK